MKLKEKELTETAVREGIYIGLVNAFPNNALLTIETPEVIEQISNAVMSRLSEILVFDEPPKPTYSAEELDEAATK